MNEQYESLLQAKINRPTPSGFEPKPFIAPLFPWQQRIVSWALQQGRCALFEECGLGKTIQQLEWAQQVCQHTGGDVLILAPLAVAAQTIAEGKRFKIRINGAKEDAHVNPGITITNYERLERFNTDRFAGVVLDESSILKAFTGKTRNALVNRFAKTPYRLCCTATPAPNDYMELGEHAEFLGVSTTQQMLATYFINDTFDTGDWRLKGHAHDLFWEWVSTWAACVSKPSDIGFSDSGYILPALNLQQIEVAVEQTEERGEGELFRMPSLSATNLHKELRLTTPHRVEEVAKLVNGNSDIWLVWCNSNYESDALLAAIPEATEVRGSDKPERKEQVAMDFVEGKIRVLISKPSIFGFGMNFQHCHNVAFVGLSYSFEDFYQALRRTYRFGQAHPVNAFIVQAQTEGAILSVVRRKMEQHEEMKREMRFAAAFLTLNTHKTTMKTDINIESGQGWEMHHGDCVRVAATLADSSIGMSVFSPPFADLFTYSNDVADMGNCASMDDFTNQFGFLIDQLMRVTMPGRECAVHCCDLLATKWKDGSIEFKDFSGSIVRAFRERGWQFHSRITIWKSPVTEMQRTKAHGLLYKTLRADSSKSRVGSADYLLVFRKPGENPVPITHDPSELPLDLWQELASPVWMTVKQSRVLNGTEAREDRDERHICPLQLDVIERALTLWSAPGDIVFSPFAGIGSEGVCALNMKRKFIGAELKGSYWKMACGNLAAANVETGTLFDVLGAA